MTAVAALVAGLAAVVTLGAAPATAAPTDVAAAASDSVTADALPTVQINGVAWTQLVVGNTVYVGGDFTSARPAGAPAGTDETPRSYLLAYDITTGNLITSFAPVLNGQVQTLALSPDGSRFYAGGNFTTVDGKTHNRVVAFDAATGAMLNSFNGSVDAGVHALAVSDTTVYVGGLFQYANGNPRSQLAAFDTTGALTAWAPTADDTVEAMILSPDKSRLIIGGHFKNVNGAAVYGMGSLDAVSGANLPWAASTVLRDAGPNSAILSFTSDGTNIIGTGYSYSSGGNFEGTFSADPATGSLNWMEDCHGDTYGAFVSHGLVYTVSHAHYCGNVGGWPVYGTWQFRRSVAFTNKATGTLRSNAQAGYADFGGRPSPSLVNWFPDYEVGTYTGQNQAAWSVTGNSDYVVEGGEFPTVNNVAQQGLVRYAVRGIAPAKSGPRLSGARFVPTVNTWTPGTAHVSFQADWDRDDRSLSYSLVRNSDTAHPIWTGKLDSTWWDRPTTSFNDTGLTPGTTYRYRLYVTDGDGNQAVGDTVTYTVPTTVAGLNAYDSQVLADGASTYWGLDEASGSVALDRAGGNDADLVGVTRGASGPVSPGTATTLAGNANSYLATRDPLIAPDTMTTSAWVRTTSSRGGKIVAFGSWQTGAAAIYDRQLTLDTSGRAVFGVRNTAGTAVSVSSTSAINDGQWHQVVGQLGATGMTLYVDGVRVARRTDTTSGYSYLGYWRMGGDNLNASVADVALYPSLLTSAQVRNQYQLSGRSASTATPPTDAYGRAVYADDPDIFWRLDENPGTTAPDASTTGSPGVYSGRNYTAQTSPVTTAGRAVGFPGATTNIGSSRSYSNPQVYSEQAWFKTATTAGGKLLGFGNRQSGGSSSYDRHVYMLASGKLVFGAYNNGFVTVTSAASYNDNKWHQVVATQGPAGMTLYVDGQPVGTNPNTVAANYTGYWRVGGDTTVSGAAYFTGTIDEAAFYSTALPASRVLAQYKASTASVNTAPTAAFTSSSIYLKAAFDASTSTDVDGSVAAYSWNFGDGATGSGATPNHAYASGGTYNVTLTVTDNEGATGSTTRSITVVDPPPNQLPTASFTKSCTNTACTFDASGSSDPDGSVVGYAWAFGDGTTATGATTSHTFAAGGSYQVTLTVTDDRSGTASSTATVTVNQAPTASFTTSAVKLAASFDAGASKDADGSIASYRWDFGDGSNGTGVTAKHRYAAAGTYPVTLTVTDDAGATDSRTTSITVVAPGLTTYAADDFGRTTASGLGAADVGGSYTTSGGASSFSVGGGTAALKIATAGTGPAAFLNTVSARDVQGVVDMTFDSTPTGGGSFGYVVLRHVGSTDYRLRVKLLASSVALSVSKVVGGVETVLATKTLTGLTYSGGTTLRLRFEAVGSSPTTLLGRAWPVTATEPTTWQVSATDAEAALQGAGGVGYQAYLAASSTTLPVIATVDNVRFTAVTAASFTATSRHLATTLDASASTSTGGTVTGYGWDFGDGTTGTGKAPAHTYATAGTYPVTLTVTDSVGGTDAVSQDVTVAANKAPTAAFTETHADLSATVDASTSSDADGTVASYAWDFGDGATATGVTASHTYSVAGTYTVTLTVRDDDGAQNTTTRTISVLAPDVPPTASFSTSMTNLTAFVDGSASTDPDGTVASWSWNFGDGATAAGTTATHVYASPGDYVVTLTVVDDRGAATSTSRTVTASPVPPVATDSFARTTSPGWGSADVGGPWTLSGSSSLFSVGSGRGSIKLATAGAGPAAVLTTVSARDVDESVDFGFDSVPTGGGTFAYLLARRVGTTDYRLKVKVLPTAVTLYLAKVVNGTETALVSKTVSLSYALGDVLRARFTVRGTGTSTLTGTVWKAGTTQPAAAQLTTTDTDAALQGAGGVGLQTYLSGSATVVPVVTSFANFAVAAG